MTKPYGLFLIFILVSLNSFSQIDYHGKVIDKDSGNALERVRIINTISQDTLVSNSNGFFRIPNSGNYKLQKFGFYEQTVDLTTTSYRIISLEPNPSKLSEVIVNANHLPTVLEKATATINIISKKDIERSNNINFAPILNRVPGLFMQSGALNTNRITIRGIGSRTLYGTSKIRAYFKDIPLTNGSGETTIEDFELASISNIEIIKGATSSSYGAGLGGTIILKPQNSYLNQSSLNNELTVGSFGLIKGIANLNLGFKNNSIRAVYSHTQSDGYRDNNNYNRQTFTLSSQHYINDTNEISVLGSLVNLKAFIPSSINASDFENNPEKAAFTWQQSQGFEDANRGILGLSWNHQYNSNLKQITSVFTSFRTALEPRPFNVLRENSFAVGLRTRLLGNIIVFNKPLNYTFGGEIFNDTYTARTFENLYEDFPAGTGSVEGSKLSDFEEDRRYFNLFFETDYSFSDLTTLTFGLNLNQTSYDLDDNFPSSEVNPDQSGTFKYNTILSPKLGLSHLISEEISLFASVSHGFSPISLNETLLPDGQINTDLRPETGWNFEIGTRGQLLKNRLQYTASLYRLDIKNLVVSRRTALDQFIGINAGRTRHDGLELSLDYKWLQNEAFQLSSFLSYTYNNYTFQDFVDNETDFSGNDLTGVPNQIANLGIDFNTAWGLYGNINQQYVGTIPITDSNLLYTESYMLTNLKFGYKNQLSKGLTFNIFTGLNNLFDKHYAAQVLINATGFGDSAPRYYYPGNPVNYFSGLNLNYVF